MLLVCGGMRKLFQGDFTPLCLACYTSTCSWKLEIARGKCNNCPTWKGLSTGFAGRCILNEIMSGVLLRRDDIGLAGLSERNLKKTKAGKICLPFRSGPLCHFWAKRSFDRRWWSTLCAMNKIPIHIHKKHRETEYGLAVKYPSCIFWLLFYASNSFVRIHGKNYGTPEAKISSTSVRHDTPTKRNEADFLVGWLWICFSAELPRGSTIRMVEHFFCSILLRRIKVSQETLGRRETENSFPPW